MEVGRRLAGLAFRDKLRTGQEFPLLPGDVGRSSTARCVLRGTGEVVIMDHGFRRLFPCSRFSKGTLSPGLVF
jgi:hypothetical protein